MDISVEGAHILQKRPQAFQKNNGIAHAFDCNYHLNEDGQVGLELSGYDPNLALLIDPVLNFSTYLGGTSFGAIYAMTVDSAGNIYVTGETSSGSLSNASAPNRASPDVFVAKLNNTATQLLYVAYLGGSGDDSGKAIAVDSAGNVYVTGVTMSSNFPVTTGVLSNQSSGGEDAFVFKLDPTGHLLYSTYLGGERDDSGLSIAVDGSGNAYVAGQTSSTAFPATSGAFQSSNHGGLSDCFVSKLNATGSGLIYSTFLGGGLLDKCEGVALDASGNAYVTGTTYSSDFPMMLALQSSLAGTANAFAAKINSSGSALIYSTYLGGSSLDSGNSIAVDASGSAYIAGDASSTDFPTTAAAFQMTLNGYYNAFVSKLSADGSTLVYSTFLGGSGNDCGTSIVVDQAGRAVLGGSTTSSDFPVANAFQTTFGGSFDAFGAVLDPSGATLVFSSFFGGSGDDRGYAVAVLPGMKCTLQGRPRRAAFRLRQRSRIFSTADTTGSCFRKIMGAMRRR